MRALGMTVAVDVSLGAVLASRLARTIDHEVSMQRLAVVSLLLSVLMGLLFLFGLPGEYHLLAKITFLGMLVLFAISSAAAAWRSA